MAGDLINGEIPDHWEFTTLGDVCQRGGGSIQTGPFGSQLHASDYVPVGIPSIMPTNIGDNRVVEDGIVRITEDDANRLGQHRLRSGDIVYSRRGDVEKRALIREREEGWLCGTGCLKVRLGSGVVDPLFASMFLGHPAIREWIVRHAIGATMPNLNTSIMSAVPFVLPPIAEQKATAAVLGVLDDKIELNRRMNATLEAMARALFQSWFVDFDPVRAKLDGRRPIGLGSATAALFPAAFQDSTFGPIPCGWEVGTLGTLFGPKSDCVLTGPFGSNLHASDYSTEGVPLILVKHVMDGRIIEDRLPLVADKKVTELARYRLQLGDIVFTRVGAVGRTGYVHQRNIGWLISGQTLRVRVPNWEILHPRYLAQVYLEPAFIAMVEGHSLGTTRPSLNTGLLRDFRFIIPPSALANRFAEIVTIFDEQRQHLDAQSRTLASLRDTLLPKLLSGELSIAAAKESIELVR